MAAKRKGGLKLNAICAKLSRQVVVEKGAEAGSRAEGSPLRPRDKERSGPEAGVARAPRSEEDKRRAGIEKWVNGEYSEEPVPVPMLGRIAREGLELPPEGVYMVQPQGCSDEEDHGEEPAKDGTVVEEKDSDGAASKDDSGPTAKQASGWCLKTHEEGGLAGKEWGVHRACLLPSLVLQIV